jgi:GNAT superfamily N-acetyltransferase
MADLQGCHVRMGTREDMDKILGLINRVQPDIPWSPEHFLWQFYGTDGANSSLLYLIISGDDVVSLYSAIKKRCWVGGELREAVMVQDVMTHPDFRGRGFLDHLARVCAQDILDNGFCAYTFPNKLSENSFRRNGWTELSGIPLREMELVPRERGLDSAGCMAEPVACFDERAARIWGASGIAVGVYRDAEFLNWRYSRPGTEYFRFYMRGDEGYLVLKLFDRGDTKVLHLLDLVVSAASKDMVRSALEFTRDFATKMKADRLTCWLHQAHPYAQVFEEFGLALDTDSDRVCFVRSPERDEPRFSDAAAWHLTQGDSDIY